MGLHEYYWTSRIAITTQTEVATKESCSRTVTDAAAVLQMVKGETGSQPDEAASDPDVQLATATVSLRKLFRAMMQQLEKAKTLKAMLGARDCQGGKEAITKGISVFEGELEEVREVLTALELQQETKGGTGPTLEKVQGHCASCRQNMKVLKVLTDRYQES